MSNRRGRKLALASHSVLRNASLFVVAACFLTSPRQAAAEITTLSANRSGGSWCVNYIVSYPYAFSGSQSQATSALSGSFGRNFEVRDAPYVTGCTAITSVSSNLSPGFLTFDANGSAIAPNLYGSQVSFHGMNSAGAQYEFRISQPATARIIAAAPEPRQRQSVSLYWYETQSGVLSVSDAPVDVNLTLQPGHYYFSASSESGSSSPSSVFRSPKSTPSRARSLAWTPVRMPANPTRCMRSPTR